MRCATHRDHADETTLPQLPLVFAPMTGFPIVLNNDERVAEIAEAFERVEEATIVARMQSDSRLIQHVEHAGQAAADLARQADALGLAAGKRGSGPVYREVFKPDIDQNTQAPSLTPI